MLSRRVLLVGGVNLPGPEAVFRAVAKDAGDVVERIPDGETDARNDWIVAQIPVLRRQAQLEPGEPFTNGYRSHPRWKIRDGIEPDEVVLGSLGYTDAAAESYAIFTRLKREGVIPADMRFQISLPTPLAVVGVFIDPQDALRFEPVYERHMLGEMEAIAELVPHEELAFQWDVAVEFFMIEGEWPAYFPGDLLTGLVERTARMVDAIPADVQAGVHLCYGDSEGKHFKDPEDAAYLAAVGGGVLAAIHRPLDWLHLPVPIQRDDEAYFAPLAGLELPAETTLYVGLLHKEDGLEGARRRIAAARVHVPEFGVATECGMSRDATPEEIPGLLRLHADVARELEGVVAGV